MEHTLKQSSLIRPIYSALINNGRTYAAFEREHVFPLVEELSNRKEILDPMSGYGTLMTYCAEKGISSFNLECNPPAFLWEVLIHPAYTDRFIKFIKKIVSSKDKWPRTNVMAIVSGDWFPDESRRIILELLALFRNIANKVGLTEREALSFLLPFVGRLSSSVSGNITTHVKQGGICVYKDWRKDFLNYIEVLDERLKENRTKCKSSRHELLLGDCRTMQFPKRRFSAMITSPPYPNGRDYRMIFAPENECIEWLTQENVISDYLFKERLIGSVRVSPKYNYKTYNNGKIKSLAARRFLRRIEDFKGTEEARRDNKIYYLPYYRNYFSDLEKAYENVAGALSKNFMGFVVVVDNTARNEFIPVSRVVVDIWNNLGFKAKIENKLTREMSHFGAINPRAKGFRAKHQEFTIKIWK